eukprot:maker-scaffold_2-snap-gene-4.57-mRNA-1 protein AED:0.00 eAED:0.00 QI:27/1/1/1/0/0.5/2/73/327
MNKLMRGFVSGKGLQSLPIPSLSLPTDVLIKVNSFGINGPDVLQNKGFYPPPPGVTDVLGLECSGEIVEAANSSIIGKKVSCLVPGGTYAEYCKANESLCFFLPNNYSEKLYSNAGGIPETLFTCWKNVLRIFFLEDKIKEMQNTRFLIYGASGGIGSTCILLLKHFGVKDIVAVYGSEDKKNYIEKLGVDSISYLEENWMEKAGKFDFILDVVGAKYLDGNLKMLNPKGKLVLLGMLGGSKVQDLDLTRILLKSLTVTGSVLRSQPDEHKIMLKKEIEKFVWPEIVANKLDLGQMVTQNYAGLDEVEKAIDEVSGRKHVGKVVVNL